MFQQMCKFIPEQKEVGRFKTFYKVFTEEDVKEEKFRRIWEPEQYAEIYGLEAGTYVCLLDKEKSEIVMSDTWMEQETNKEVIEKANGRVLIAGLGIGLILLPIQEKDNVTEVIVIEKNKEIIDLIAPYLPINKKVKIICDDIFTYDIKDKFDTIYFDIWNGVCGDNYKDMKLLKKKYKSFLNKDNPNNYISSWRLRDCRKLNYRDNKENKIFKMFNKDCFEDLE